MRGDGRIDNGVWPVMYIGVFYFFICKDIFDFLLTNSSFSFKQSETFKELEYKNGIACSLKRFSEKLSKSCSIFELFPSSSLCNAKFTKASDKSPPFLDIFEIKLIAIKILIK